MSVLFDLAEVAKNLAEAAKDAMRSEGESEPDEVSGNLAQHVIEQAKTLVRGDVIVQNLNLVTRRWVSVRSAMEAVAVKLDSRGHEEVTDSVRRINQQRIPRRY